jgi:uncharacterized protein YggE
MRTLTLILSICLAAATAAAGGTLTVTGRGEVFASPDEARVTVGVTTEAVEASVAMRENSEAMAVVMGRLAEEGIVGADMQTTSLSLQPRWDHRETREDGAPRIVGFVATNMLTVRVRDLAALGGVLDAVLGDGANTLGGLQFGISDDRALRDEARRAAVADATAKAEVLAEAAGLTLGPVEEIAEGGAQRPVPFARMDMAMAESVPVAPGEVSLDAVVTMTWSIGD